jgi:hypothetical protein
MSQWLKIYRSLGAAERLVGITDQKIANIHNNPVEAGYVTNPESWYYSSACAVSPLKVLET